MRHELCSVGTFGTRSANETAPPLGFTTFRLRTCLRTLSFTHPLPFTTWANNLCRHGLRP